MTSPRSEESWRASSLADQLTTRYEDRGITKVVGIESGVYFGGILAAVLGWICFVRTWKTSG